MASDILPAKSRQRSGHRRIRGANLDTNTYSNTYSYTNSNTYADADTDTNADTNTYADTYSNTNAYSCICCPDSATDQCRRIECLQR